MKVSDYHNEDGFWVGEGGGASGVLPICPSTGRVCLAWRSIEVDSGDCWGTLGGAVQKGRTPAESAKIEMGEETGYHGGITLHPAYVFTSGSFKYHNFIGVVQKEFAFHPSGEHSWETDFIEWVLWDEVRADLAANSNDYHPGLLALFKNSGELIQNLMASTEKVAAKKENPDAQYTEGSNGWALFPNEREDFNSAAPLKEMIEGGHKWAGLNHLESLGLFVVEEASLSGHELYLVGATDDPTWFELAFQQKGQDASDIGQQSLNLHPLFLEKNKLFATIRGWLQRYPKIHIMSHNKEYLAGYLRLLRLAGFTVGKEPELVDGLSAFFITAS